LVLEANRRANWFFMINILFSFRFGLMFPAYTQVGFKTGFKRLKNQPESGLIHC